MKKNLLGISLITITGLYILLSVIVLGACIVTDIPIIFGIIASIVIVVIQFLISPYLTDLSMKWFYKARFDHAFPEYLNIFIDETCKKHNMKRPKLGFIDDGSPNAFTYGHTKNDATIILTRGDFELLSEEEIKTVVAHELGHATHYDMLFMTVAQLVPLVLYLIYETLAANNNSNSDDNKAAIIGYVAYLLYIISQYIVLWLSRTREYYADEFSIRETKNPNALAEALVKIGFGLVTNKEKEVKPDPKDKKAKKEALKNKKHSTENAGALGIFDSKTSKSLIVMTNNGNNKSTIKNAMKWEMWNPWAFLFELNSTHPLISKRLLNISAYSKEYNQEPYIVFDLKKPESYVDDFAVELLIVGLPYIVVIASIILCIIFRRYISLIAGVGLILLSCALLIGFNRSHKKGYKKTTIENLLGEVKVSGITSVPCELTGKVIGRGDAGNIFNEDMMVRDETGIMLVDYKTPSFIINKIVAFLKTPGFIDKDVILKGWYRRSPVPYVEVFEFIIDGKTHKTGQVTFNMIMFGLLALAGIAVIVIGLI